MEEVKYKLSRLIGQDRLSFLIDTAFRIKELNNKSKAIPLIPDYDLQRTIHSLLKAKDKLAESNLQKAINAICEGYLRQKRQKMEEFTYDVLRVYFHMLFMYKVASVLIKDESLRKKNLIEIQEMLEKDKNLQAKIEEDPDIRKTFEILLFTEKEKELLTEIIKDLKDTELEKMIPCFYSLQPEASIKKSRNLHHVIFLVYFIASDCIVLEQKLDKLEEEYKTLKKTKPDSLYEQYKRLKKLEKYERALKDSWRIRELLSRKWSLIKKLLFGLGFGNFDSDNIRRQIFNKHKDRVFHMYYFLQFLPDSNLPDFELIDIHKTIEWEGFPEYSNGKSLIPEQ